MSLLSWEWNWSVYSHHPRNRDNMHCLTLGLVVKLRQWDYQAPLSNQLDRVSTLSSSQTALCIEPISNDHQNQKLHDDVIKWKHFPRYWPFVQGIHRSPVNSPHKGQWRGALMFSLICVCINGWVNNREAGDLKRHRAHYHVIVMHVSQNIWFELRCIDKKGHILVLQYDLTYCHRCPMIEFFGYFLAYKNTWFWNAGSTPT